jgi:hypothetical protein
MRARTQPLFLLLVLAAATLLAPSRALATDCQTDRASDQIFAHPYGEPPAPCPTEAKPAAGSSDVEHENILADDRGPRKLRNIGISGMEGGASVAALGGLMLVCSLFLSEQTKGHDVLHWGGIGVASVGGGVFVAGAALVGIDYLMAPAPTPDKKGAQLMLAFRF